MNRLGGPKARTAVLAIAAVIVVGGFVLALISSMAPGTFAGPQAAATSNYNGPIYQVLGGAGHLAGGVSSVFSDFGLGSQPGNTQVVNPGTSYAVTTTTTTMGAPPAQTQPGSNVTQGAPPSGGGSIEFSSDVTIASSSPRETASAVVALAYSVGGYVAYQSTYSDSANVVIRVPAGQYSDVLGKVEGLGTVVVLTSNSNDVTVQYTDLNATLASLQAEQGALLRLLNGSTTINSTLAIESQLQGVNQQINEVQSQILQTRTLISYATINVSITEKAQQSLLTISLSAIPTNGTAPLSVTFNAVVKGGAQPYVINYNFGDGYATQGQIVIHTYTQPGSYKVVVYATDQNGTVAQASKDIRVTAPQAGTSIGRFFGNVGGLFVSVVEGIVEVAAVVLPVAAVGAAIYLPIQRRGRAQKGIKQSQ